MATDPDTDTTTQQALAPLPPPCQPGSVPDCYAIWRQLVELWGARANPDGTPRTGRQLASALGVPPQNVAQWKTGSSGKSCAPWHAIMHVAHEVGVVVVLDPEHGACLHERVQPTPVPQEPA